MGKMNENMMIPVSHYIYISLDFRGRLFSDPDEKFVGAKSCASLVFVVCVPGLSGLEQKRWWKQAEEVLYLKVPETTMEMVSDGFPVQMSTFVQMKTRENCVLWLFQVWQAASKMLPNLAAALRIANMAACREGQASHHSVPKRMEVLSWAPGI